MPILGAGRLVTRGPRSTTSTMPTCSRKMLSVSLPRVCIAFSRSPLVPLAGGGSISAKDIIGGKSVFNYNAASTINSIGNFDGRKGVRISLEEHRERRIMEKTEDLESGYRCDERRGLRFAQLKWKTKMPQDMVRSCRVGIIDSCGRSDEDQRTTLQ